MRKIILEQAMPGRRKTTSVKNLALFTFLLLLIGVASTRVHAVDIFTISNFGGASQIWWEAELFDERIPDNEDFFALSVAPDGEDAFGDDALNTINRIGGGGRITYTFDINQLGAAGTWYFWGRVINPSNRSDYMLVEGHPGDVIPTGTPGGVGIGMKPPQFLQVGDVVRIAIDGIGEIENAVISEPEETTRIG